jgi:hypothetical protein
MSVSIKIPEYDEVECNGSKAITIGIKAYGPPDLEGISYCLRGNPKNAQETLAARSASRWPVESSFSFAIEGKIIRGPSDWLEKNCEVMFNPLGGWQDDFEFYQARGYLGECEHLHEKLLARLFLQDSWMRDIIKILGLFEHKPLMKQEGFFFQISITQVEQDQKLPRLSSKVIGVDFWGNRQRQDELS